MSINSATADARPLTGGAAAVVLAARVLLSILFIAAGFGKLTTIGDTSAWFGSLGLPLPGVVTVLVGLLELGGGLALIAGFHTRVVAIVLALFTLAATAVAHLHFADQMQMLMLQKNLAITGGFLALAVLGGGAYSVDAKRG